MSAPSLQGMSVMRVFERYVSNTELEYAAGRYPGDFRVADVFEQVGSGSVWSGPNPISDWTRPSLLVISVIVYNTQRTIPSTSMRQSVNV
jgi:hypothetical protein